MQKKTFWKQYEMPDLLLGAVAIAAFLVTGAIDGVCVPVWGNLFIPSAGANIQMGIAEMGEMKSAADMIVGALTVGDFNRLLTKSNMLPLIIFSMIFGFCVAACGGEESPVGKFLTNLNEVIMKFIGVIMTIAPIGLGAYFANLIAVYGPELIGDYGWSMVVYYPLCLLYVVISFPLYALFAGGKLGFRRMLKYIITPAVTAFNEAYARYFTSKPARSCVAVKELPKGVACEIEAIAVK